MIDRPRGVAPVAHLSKMSPPRPPPSELVAGLFPSHGRAGPRRRSKAASRWLAIASLVSLVPRAGEDYLVPGGPVAACDAWGGHSGLPHRRLVGQAPGTPRPPLHLRPHPHLGLSGRTADGSHGPREGRVSVQVMVHQLRVAPAQTLRDVVCAHHVIHVNPPPHA